MFDFSLSLPSSPDSCAHRELHVHEISANPATLTGRCRKWHTEVQPSIASNPDRADRDWNWRRIAILTTFGGARRRARVFQVALGPDQAPAAMISLLEHERWPADYALKACFLWFLSTAPSALLQRSEDDGRLCVPKLVGNSAFQIALAIALRGAAEGRLWLHAAPEGGHALFDWYRSLRMEVIDPARFPTLPGYDSSARIRRNDGRYFWLDGEASREVHAAFLTMTRQS